MVLNVIQLNILYVTVLIQETILTLSWNQTRYILPCLMRICVINDSNIKMSKLVGEALGMAMLDSAYSQTITRKLWFDIFFDTLNDQDKCSVKTAKSNRPLIQLNFLKL